MSDATCIVCRCTDSRACEGGCSWLAVDARRRIGVCSACLLPRRTAADRSVDRIANRVVAPLYAQIARWMLTRYVAPEA